MILGVNDVATLVIPVRADLPAYKFQIDLESVLYTFSFRYNERMDRWIMDIADQNENDILLGTPILTRFNLVERFKTASLPPGEFFALDESGNAKQPGRDDLGNDVKLFYVEAG